MRQRPRRTVGFAGLVAVALSLIACGSAAAARPPGEAKIKHVVVTMLENRSFDSMLGWLYKPGTELRAPGTAAGRATFEGLTGKESNRVVNADGSGRTFIGGFGYDLYAGAPQKPGPIFRIDPDGTVAVVDTDMVFPNGAVILPGTSTLVVAETPGAGSGRLLALPVTRVRARSDDPEEPIFFLTGGPGQSNLDFAYADRYTADHDVVLVGFRGVDGSVRLDCPEVDSAFKRSSDLLAEESFEAYGAAYRVCADRLVASGTGAPPSTRTAGRKEEPPPSPRAA